MNDLLDRLKFWSTATLNADGELPKQWQPYVDKLEQRIEELERARLHDIEQEAVLLKRIEELEARLDAVLGIKYHTHPSWNCGKDFDDGWNACRKQIDACIEQALGGDDE